MYSSREPYALLLSGRPEEPESHRGIAVYSKEEFDQYRKKGWKTEREFTAMHRRSLEHPKGDWHE